MKLSKRAERLFLSAFTTNGRLSASQVGTSEGTMPLWGQLVLAGLVEQRTSFYQPFSYEITEEGRQYIASRYNV